VDLEGLVGDVDGDLRGELAAIDASIVRSSSE